MGKSYQRVEGKAVLLIDCFAFFISNVKIFINILHVKILLNYFIFKTDRELDIFFWFAFRQCKR